MTPVAVFRHSLFALLSVLAFAASGAALAEESDPPGRVARLSLIDGEVSFAPAGTDDWAEAVLNRPITSEDRLSVGVDGRAELQVGSASVHLDRQTQFGFIELDDDVMQMSLVDGAATIRVRRLSERETIKVETPNATVHLRHVGEYHLEVDPDSDQTIVKTRSGEAEVTGGASSYVVRANEQGAFRGLDNLSARTDPIPPRTPFESWANDRDRREEQSRSARYVSRDVVGYEDLDDHGEWVHERDYGYVWRPTYVVQDWAPYRYGRWAWVSPWGWTWIDNAAWGYAPFHYGRWVHVRHRWHWVPGPRHLRPVYAPALVAWIGGPSVSVSVSLGHGVGWYPLAPHEVYYPGYRHTPRYIRHVNVSNTIIVNNAFITNVYGRHPHQDHRYRGHERAVTAVRRDHFASGRPLSDHRVRLGERDLRQWRDEVRPPAIAPYRESVLAAQPRQVRHEARAGSARREGDWLMHRGDRQRVDFTAERQAIESNGGRPISRTQLTARTRSREGERARSHQIENPKDRGDFRAPRRDDGVKREARQQVERGGEGPSVRSQRPTPEYRAPALRASGRDAEPAQRERQTQWRAGPSTQHLRAAPERSEPTPRFDQREMRAERAPPVQTHREAPRQSSSPEPRVRSDDSSPRQEQHSPRQEQRSSRHESSSGRERSGSSRDHGASRTR